MAITEINLRKEIDVGPGTISYEEGRLDTHLFNDYSIELRDNSLLFWEGTNFVKSIIIDNLDCSLEDKNTIKQAIAKAKELTSPTNYIYGFTNDFSVEWDGLIFNLTYSADLYMMGYFSSDHTAPYKKLSFNTSTDINTEDIEEGLRVLVISGAIIATLILLYFLGPVAAGTVAGILNGLMGKLAY